MRVRSRNFALALTATVVGGLLCTSAQAQLTTFPNNLATWMQNSEVAQNKYLFLWEYARGADISRFNLWTGRVANPRTQLDNLFFIATTDANGVTTAAKPWGSRIVSSARPPYPANNADERPVGNVLSLRVQDPTAATGFQIYSFPEDGSAEFAFPDPLLPLDVGSSNSTQGFSAPYRFPAAPVAGGINMVVDQKVSFARDLLRIEVTVRNEGGGARTVQPRLVLDTAVEFHGGTRSMFIPATREKVTRERDYVGAAIPAEWEAYDDDVDPNPVFTTKGILKGNGATTPSRVVFGNMLDIIPWAIAGDEWDWTVRPSFSFTYADMGTLIYWPATAINTNQTKSFVTYVGLAAASHGMSQAYENTQSNVPVGESGQGFVGALQTSPGLPLVNGNADGVVDQFTAFMQNVSAYGLPGSFAFIDLPDGLQFDSTNPDQSARVDFGFIDQVGSVSDEANDDWFVEPNGIDAGLLPVTVTFGNGFTDTARVTRLVNVPQGRRYQFNNDWKMITFPFDFDSLGDDPAEAFRELDGQTPLNSGSFQIVRYNPAVGIYENVTEIVAGQSYWVRMLGTGVTDMRLSPEAEPAQTSGSELTTTRVYRGWNQVGNPSPYAVRLGDVRVFSGNVTISWDQAVSGNLIRGSAFQWDWKEGEYRLLDRDSVVKPGAGIWIFSNSERDLAWPAPTGPGVSITNSN